MKKVGILTFQRAVNYGAVLQMYALQKKIQDYRCKAEIIDYNSEKISEGYRAFSIKKIIHPRSFISSLVNYNKTNKRNHKFWKFKRNYMNFSLPVQRDKLASIDDIYDCYIVGSDQIWNPDITGDDASYFLDFVVNNKKKYSYAASFGVAKWPTTSKLPLQQLLSQFNRISVREKTGADIVKSMLPNKKNIFVNLDPVFLLEKSDWQSFVQINGTENASYLFVYTVGVPQKVYAFAQKLAEEKNLKIVNLRYTKSLRNKQTKIGKVIYDASPDEFVSYIANAACVVTNSFHATAFSVIFNKDIYVEMPQGLSSRIQDLFQLLNITNRTIGYPVDKLDWDKINKKLAKAREKSLQYLEEILS